MNKEKVTAKRWAHHADNMIVPIRETDDRLTLHVHRAAKFASKARDVDLDSKRWNETQLFARSTVTSPRERRSQELLPICRVQRSSRWGALRLRAQGASETVVTIHVMATSSEIVSAARRGVMACRRGKGHLRVRERRSFSSTRSALSRGAEAR